MMMASWFFCLLLGLSLLLTCTAGEVHYHDFVVRTAKVTRLCKRHKIVTVNGQLPGPMLMVRDGDSLVVKVVNRATYNVTIHWHGVRQMRTAWADGLEYVTQCPITPGKSYTYRFTISGQAGTLWWHAHSSWLRATVYGVLIIYPKDASHYPFPMPNREAHLILGEWWNANPIDVIDEATKTGAAPNISDAFTINGQPGDLYPCSSKGTTTTIRVAAGETNLFRFINGALNTELFVSIAGHTMTVVGADASYVKPFSSSVIMLGPGQTTDVLVTADQPPGKYYVAARAYASAQGISVDNTTVTAVIEYESANLSCTDPPSLPVLPAYNDTATATAFSNGFKSLSPVKLPEPIDENLFFTVGVGLFRCPPSEQCLGPNGTRFTASMNNVSFRLPSTFSIQQARLLNVSGVYTADFPASPPRVFDYTGVDISRELWRPVQATKVYPLKYGATVELVLQGTNIFAGENHPMHLHGYNFYVLATGFGNFDSATDKPKFNLVDPPMRNTIGVPVNGWAVVRFVADNPGAWMLHCHLDVHITWGLAMVFMVEDGVGESETLEPPPADLPPC